MLYEYDTNGLIRRIDSDPVQRSDVAKNINKNINALARLTAHEDGIKKNNPKKTIMRKLTDHLKRILSPDLQEQYKAGYLCDNLSLSPRGMDALQEILIEKFQPELTARAKAANEEAKKEKE